MVLGLMACCVALSPGHQTQVHIPAGLYTLPDFVKRLNIDGHKISCDPALSNRVVAARFENRDWNECIKALCSALDLKLTRTPPYPDLRLERDQEVAVKEGRMRAKLFGAMIRATADLANRIEQLVREFEGTPDDLLMNAMNQAEAKLLGPPSDGGKAMDRRIESAAFNGAFAARYGWGPAWLAAWNAGLFPSPDDPTLSRPIWADATALPKDLLRATEADNGPGKRWRKISCEWHYGRGSHELSLVPQGTLFSDDSSGGPMMPPAIFELFEANPNRTLAEGVFRGSSDGSWPGMGEDAADYNSERDASKEATAIPEAEVTVPGATRADSLPTFLLAWSGVTHADFVEECQPFADTFDYGRSDPMSLKSALTLTSELAATHSARCWVFKDALRFVERAQDTPLDAVLAARARSAPGHDDISTSDVADAYFAALGPRRMPERSDNGLGTYLDVPKEVFRGRLPYLLWRNLGSPIPEKSGRFHDPANVVEVDLSRNQATATLARDLAAAEFGEDSYLTTHITDCVFQVWRRTIRGKDQLVLYVRAKQGRPPLYSAAIRVWHPKS